MEQSSFFNNLRKLITIVDNLRDIGLEEYIKLPKIVVVGQQSAGKSSLLQQIVGIDFLPRGSGVVTRRPLEMRLVYVPKQAQPKPYAVFQQVPNKKFTDFQQVKRTIQEVTQKVCGKNKGIVNKPIILYVYSSNCPNLTMVDLPGLTRIAIPGQPQNIYEVIEQMTKQYIEDQLAIILCVVAANQDLSTSEAIHLVRKIDKKGQRTLGCLTKIDIMDKGTNARKILLNQQIALKLGYVGIKCRSQQDIIQNKTVLDSLEAEKVYFATSGIYSSLPPGHTGTGALVQKLTDLLYKQIKKFMPKLTKQLSSRINELQGKLKQLGPAMPRTLTQKINTIWHYTNEFMKRYKNSIEGKYQGQQGLQEYAGPQIRQKLLVFFRDQFEQRGTQDIMDQQIDKALKLYGNPIPGFLSIDAFLYLLVPLLQKLKEPAQSTLNQVTSILQKTALKQINTLVDKYPLFKQQLIQTFQNLLFLYKKKTYVVINQILDSQIGYIFTNNSTYLTGSFQLKQQQKGKVSEIVIRNPLIFQLRRRVDYYYKIVVRNLRDLIPKQICLHLMNKFIKQLQFKCSQFISQNNKIQYWLKQPQNLVQQRQKIERAYNTLKKAQRYIKRQSGISSILGDKSSIVEFKQKQQSMVIIFNKFQKMTSYLPTSVQKHIKGQQKRGKRKVQKLITESKQIITESKQIITQNKQVKQKQGDKGNGKQADKIKIISVNKTNQQSKDKSKPNPVPVSTTNTNQLNPLNPNTTGKQHNYSLPKQGTNANKPSNINQINQVRANLSSNPSNGNKGNPLNQAKGNQPTNPINNPPPNNSNNQLNTSNNNPVPKSNIPKAQDRKQQQKKDPRMANIFGKFQFKK